MKKVGYYMAIGWKEPLLFYSWYCDICKKQVINYISGSRTLICPLCFHRENIKDETLNDKFFV